MKITLNLEHDEKKLGTFTCRVPYTGAPFVTVTGATCPVCHDKVGIFDDHGVARAFSGPLNITEAKKWAESEFGPCTVEEKTPRQTPGAEFKVRSNATPLIGHAECSGPADCYRCQSRVGTLLVEFETMFGLEEDNRVLNGRYRVY